MMTNIDKKNCRLKNKDCLWMNLIEEGSILNMLPLMRKGYPIKNLLFTDDLLTPI